MALLVVNKCSYLAPVVVVFVVVYVIVFVVNIVAVNDVVVNAVIIVVDCVIVMHLLVVANADNIQLWSINVPLRLLMASLSLCGGVVKSQFCVKLKYSLG